MHTYDLLPPQELSVSLRRLKKTDDGEEDNKGQEADIIEKIHSVEAEVLRVEGKREMINGTQEN